MNSYIPPLTDASLTATHKAFSNVIINYGLDKEWLKNNPFYEDPQAEILRRGGWLKARDIPVSQKVNYPGLPEYIAASGIVHFFDAFSYLGGALRALLRGDTAIARHLAYYSELRSALSILAGRGIGIFDHIQVFVGATDQSLGRALGTHASVWKILSEWGSDRSAADLLETQISAYGHNLGAWLNTAGYASTTTAVAHTWINSWGVDLSKLSDDKEARNILSYRPSFSMHTQPVDRSDFTGFLFDLWRSADPSISLFEELDRFLIRSTLSSVFNAASVAGYSAKKQYALLLRQLGVGREYWRFFVGATPDPCILRHASSTVGHDDKNHYLAVLSRAFMLIRLAYASINHSFSASGIGKAYTHDWVMDWGASKFIFQKNMLISDIDDLWDDIVVSIEDIDTYYVDNPGFGLYNALSLKASDMTRLSSTEKLALWALK